MTVSQPTGTRPTALVTGASSGIGLEIARVLAQNGHDLVLVARSRDTLETVAAELSSGGSAQVRVMAKDLSAPNAAMEIVEELQKNGIAIDVLVNNAGFGMQGRFADAEPATQVMLVQVNMIALIQLTRLLLPGMVRRGRGRILNVASTAAFQPGPLMALYFASKAFVLSLSEALSDELRKTPVTVTALCPGATRTAFDKRAGMSNARLFSGHIMDAGTVARAGYRAMVRGKRVVIPGFRNRLMALAARLAPRRLVLRFVRKQNRVG